MKDSDRIHVSQGFYYYAQGRTDEVVADATCAPRASREESIPYSIVQVRIRKFAADATCGSDIIHCLLIDFG